MAREDAYGWPQVVILLEDQKQREGLSLKCHVVMVVAFTQVTLTWLPVKEGNVHGKCGPKLPGKPMEYKNMRRNPANKYTFLKRQN